MCGCATRTLNRPVFELTPRSWTNFKGLHGKVQNEFKLKVVKSFMAGEDGAKLLARQWSVPEEKIRTWASHDRLHGLDGLRPKRSAYSEQSKLQVLSHQDREQLSSRQVAAVYDIRNSNQLVVWFKLLEFRFVVVKSRSLTIDSSRTLVDFQKLMLVRTS